MKKIINFLKTKKSIKIATMIMIIFGFASFFMMSLTFNFIGNGISSVNLILGFVLGLFASILAWVISYLQHSKIKNYSDNQIKLLLMINILIIVIAILSFIFGTMGYIQKS